MNNSEHDIPSQNIQIACDGQVRDIVIRKLLVEVFPNGRNRVVGEGEYDLWNCRDQFTPVMKLDIQVVVKNVSSRLKFA